MKPAGLALIVVGFLIGLFSVFKIFFHRVGASYTRPIWFVLVAVVLASVGLALMKLAERD
ncbi:MAG: hypothetical protein K8T25_20750 [Planctomycetia bacterium]|nr:hypothetical protein [Planctomycetia bacterium]